MLVDGQGADGETRRQGRDAQEPGEPWRSRRPGTAKAQARDPREMPLPDLPAIGTTPESRRAMFRVITSDRTA